LREHYDVVLTLGGLYSDLFSLGVVALQMCYLETDMGREIYRPRQAAYLNRRLDFDRIEELLASLPSPTLSQWIGALLSPEETPRRKVYSLFDEVQINPKTLKLLSQNPLAVAPEDELYSEIEPYCEANCSRALVSSSVRLNGLTGSSITSAGKEIKLRGK
jgi:hypothetical protein